MKTIFKFIFIIILIYLIVPFIYVYGIKLATEMTCPNKNAGKNMPSYTFVMTDAAKCKHNLYSKFGIYWFLKNFPRPPLEIYQFRNI